MPASVFALLLSVSLLLAACAGPAPQPTPQTSVGPSGLSEPLESNNLILNPGAEQAANPDKPADWSPDSWGNHLTELSWQHQGAYSGQSYLSIKMQNYLEGDAKWIFKAQRLEKDSWYEYSDYSRSDGRSRLIWACHTPQGQRLYRTLWQSHASPDWRQNRFRFYNSGFRDCEVSIMHVLDRDGWLDTDHHRLSRVEGQPLKRGLVSIAFDDIYSSAVQMGAAELNKRGWKGTFAVTSRFAQAAQAPYADATQLKDLLSGGHELASHTQSHNYLTRLSSTELQNELNPAYLKDLGQLPAGLAYPFGDFNESVEAEVKKLYAYARTSLVGLNDKTTDKYRLKIVPVTSELTTSEIFTWIENAERTSTWLILLFHDLQQPGQAELNEYTTPVTQYLQVLDYIQRKNLGVLPIKEALKQL